MQVPATLGGSSSRPRDAPQGPPAQPQRVSLRETVFYHQARHDSRLAMPRRQTRKTGTSTEADDRSSPSPLSRSATLTESRPEHFGEPQPRSPRHAAAPPADTPCRPGLAGSAAARRGDVGRRCAPLRAPWPPLAPARVQTGASAPPRAHPSLSALMRDTRPTSVRRNGRGAFRRPAHCSCLRVKAVVTYLTVRVPPPRCVWTLPA